MMIYHDRNGESVSTRIRERNPLRDCEICETTARRMLTSALADSSTKISSSKDPMTGRTPNSFNLFALSSDRERAEISCFPSLRREVNRVPPMNPVPTRNKVGFEEVILFVEEKGREEMER